MPDEKPNERESPEPAPATPALASDEAARPPGAFSAADSKRASITFPLAADGSIDFEQLSERRRSQLVSIASNPKFQQNIGTAAAASAAAFDPSMCSVLYDTLSAALVGFAKVRGIPGEVAAVLAFSAGEKELLAPPTAKVLSKYVGTFKYQDELMLGVLFTTIVSGKVTALQGAMRQYLAQQQRPPGEPLPFVAPASEARPS